MSVIIHYLSGLCMHTPVNVMKIMVHVDEAL